MGTLLAVVLLLLTTGCATLDWLSEDTSTPATVIEPTPTPIAVEPKPAPAPAPQKVYQVGTKGPAGGFVFYDKGSYSDGWRYLEAAPQSTEWQSKVWGGRETVVTGADGTALGTGKQNTIDIIKEFGASKPYESKTDYAARLCSDMEINGYDDWFLPSRDELNQLYVVLKLQNIGGFPDEIYWSSSEYNSIDTWQQYFYSGNQWDYEYGSKSYNGNWVRAVRSF